MSRPNLSLLFISFSLGVIIQHNGQASGKHCGFPTHNLPRAFKPIRYDLELDPHMLMNKFRGMVEIEMVRTTKKSTSPVRHIVLHAGANLTIKDVGISMTNSVSDPQQQQQPDEADQIKVVDVCHDEQFNLLVIEMEHTSDKYLRKKKPSFFVSLRFEGFTPTGGAGLIRTSYEENNGTYQQAKRFIHTNFGRFGAHNLFPCFDEPHYRAIFRLTLDQVLFPRSAISNADVEQVIDYEGRRSRKFLFKDTPKLSPHQFGFVIGQFDHLPENISIENQGAMISLYRPYSDPTKLSRFTKDTLANVYLTLIQYFELENAFKQPIKIVSIPGVGPVLGMNVGGLILVDTQLLNHEPQKTPNRDETSYYVASIVKLIGRQLFGYVLTMQIDEQTWLFEGMVNWLALKLTDSIYKEFPYYQLLYARNQLSMAMREDAAVANQIAFPDTTFRYEVISVTKDSKRGDFVLDNRLKIKATSYISLYEESCSGKFLILLRTLFVRFADYTIQVSDFISLIKDICEWNPTRMTRYFTLKPGFALIKVSVAHRNDLSLNQEQFRSDYTTQLATSVSVGKDKFFWILPIRTLLGNWQVQIWKRRFAFRLLEYPGERLIHMPQTNDIERFGGWAKLNHEFKGFYRVLYSDQILSSFGEVARIESVREHLNELDCLNLIDDALAVFKSGKVGAYYLVNTLSAMSHYDNEILVDAMAEAYFELKQLYVFLNPFNEFISQFAVKLFGSIYLKRGYSLEDLKTSQGRLARARVYEFLVQSDFEPVIQDALTLFSSPELFKVDKIFHASILGAVARHGLDQNVAEVTDLLQSDEQKEEGLELVMVDSFTFTKSLERLIAFWELVRDSSPEKIALFTINLLRNSLAEQFIISNIIPDLLERHRHLGPVHRYNLVEAICTRLNIDYPCRPGSALLGLVEGNKSIALMIQIKETRRRNYILQRIDSNKLVFP